MTKNQIKYQAVIELYIKGLPRSEIAAKSGLSTGSVSNIIKGWKKVSGIDRLEDTRSFMKEIYKTGLTVNQCAQAYRFLRILMELYSKKDDSPDDSNDFEDFAKNIFSFIYDIYNYSKKQGIPPCFIPLWIKDLKEVFEEIKNDEQKNKTAKTSEIVIDLEKHIAHGLSEPANKAFRVEESENTQISAKMTTLPKNSKQAL